MAEAEQYSRSVLGASDEIPGKYCEPCHKVGHVAIAEGYCVDCPEYLCGPCYKIHCQHKALANHVLLDKDSLPIVTDSIGRVLDVCEIKCPIHPNKVIELFCETCDKLVCTICVATDHCQCKKVKHIPDIVKDLENTQEFQTFNEEIKSAAITISKHKEQLKANVTSSNKMRQLAKQELKLFRAEVNQFFDQLEKNIDGQITALEKKNKDTLKSASDRLDNMKKDLDQIRKDIETKSTGHRCELFIAMKQSHEKLMTFQDQFDKVRKEIRIQHYALVPSEQIQAMIRTTTEICRITTARFDSEIEIKTSTDKSKPVIFDLAIIHGHYCVAPDKGNKSIKVIDTNSTVKCVTSEITIESKIIFSVTSVSDDQVAASVSLEDGRYQMQFFTVSASGVLQKTNRVYDVDHSYHDIVHVAGSIYGLRLQGIYKLSMNGDFIRSIYTGDTHGMRKIAVSLDEQILYVTDSIKHSVTSMTLDGKIKTVYKDKDLKKPWGITVDKHGYVFVCSRGTKTILQLTADLSIVQVVIDAFAKTITYSSTNNKLYLSNGKEMHQYSLDSK